MPNLLLRNADVVFPNQKISQKEIFVENGIITPSASENSSPDETFDLSGLSLFAGFIDIHNHGAVGVDVNEASADGLREVGKFLAREGVTAWLPTFVPDSDENYRKGIVAIEEVLKTQSAEPHAQIIGVHYEGVFANEKMCGALRPAFFKSFQNGDEIKHLPRLKSGAHLTTLAPEIENGIALIEELTKHNWIVSIGHTRADTATLNRAFEAGARQVTHLFNAMTGVHHRDIGVAGWALTRKDVSCEIIADGRHVAPEMLEFALDCKTSDNLMLVSDSVAPTGLGNGNFELWNEQISVVGGITQNERGSIAGSVITMLDAVRMYRSFGTDDVEISKMASLNPAKVLGAESNRGSIETGKRADLTAIDENGNVKLALIGGNIAFCDL